MADATCIEEGCDSSSIHARRLCNKHYLRRLTTGKLEGLKRVPNAHALTNVDLEGRVADCAACGPGVPIRVRVRPSGKSGTRLTRECALKPHHGPNSSDDPRRRYPRDVTPQQRRREKLKYKYGITLEEYEARRQAQGGKCALCGAEPETLCVDHCHVTNRVRGLLCSPCNTGIGHLRDDIDILRRAIAYLTA